MLLQDDQPLHDTRQSTNLTYAIPLVNDSIHGNIFKCVANFLTTSDTAFVNATASIESKFYTLDTHKKFTFNFVNMQFL